MQQKIQTQRQDLRFTMMAHSRAQKEDITEEDMHIFCQMRSELGTKWRKIQTMTAEAVDIG
jgi:hypothetical protein